MNPCLPSQSRQYGYSLPELLTVLAIIAILLSLTLPLLSPAQANEAEQVFERFTRTVNAARARAISQQQVLILCPASSASQCGSDWSLGMLVFADHNGDGTLSAGEPVLERVQWLQSLQGELIPLSGRVEWRAFGNRQRLRISELGEILDQNGNLRWCPPANSALPAHQLVLNATGRIRLAQDSNGDGLREDSQGNALSC